MKRTMQQANMFEHMLRTAKVQSKMKTVKQSRKPVEEEPKTEPQQPEQPEIEEEVKPKIDNNKKTNKPNE